MTSGITASCLELRDGNRGDTLSPSDGTIGVNGRYSTRDKPDAGRGSRPISRLLSRGVYGVSSSDGTARGVDGRSKYSEHSLAFWMAFKTHHVPSTWISSPIECFAPPYFFLAGLGGYFCVNLSFNG